MPAIEQSYLTGLMPHILADFERREREAKYFDDPALWAWEVLGLRLWYKQEEIAEALAIGLKKSIAVRAGHGVGKSFLAAILVCWWIATRPTQYVFVASTAPSAAQVHSILWREIRRMHALSHERFAKGLIDRPLPGHITQNSAWKDDLGNLIGQGRKPPDHNEDAFQGIHAQYVLAIGDEACGLNVNMIDSLSNITSNAKSRRLLIANPTNPRSRLGEIFLDTTPREMTDDETGETIQRSLQDVWSLHHISVLDSPNFHGGGKCQCHIGQPLGLGLDTLALESLTDQSYVEEKKGEYGQDSARYKARVLGEFAFDGGNVLFPDDLLGRAMDATVFTGDGAGTVWLGMDVARSKDGDWSFLYSFTSGQTYALDPVTGAATDLTQEVGGRLRYVDKWRGVPLVDTLDASGHRQVGQATLVHQHAINLGATEVRVDAGGLGIGFIDGLRMLALGRYRVVEMNSGGPTPDSRAFYRNRDYQFSYLAKRMGEGLIDIDPTDKTLTTQLGDVTYDFIDPYGALKIESKDSMKKRGVKSPDAADAAWYACADLRHLDGPKDGDLYGRTPEAIMAEMVTSGFHKESEWWR